MSIHVAIPTVVPTHPVVAELDRLGDEIAELSAHLDAATARLLALIREFDARGGWNRGFRSCAEWLAWRVGLEPGAARERVRRLTRAGYVATARRSPRPRAGLLFQGPGPDPRRHARDRGSPPCGGARGHCGPRRADRPRLATAGPTS